MHGQAPELERRQLAIRRSLHHKNYGNKLHNKFTWPFNFIIRSNLMKDASQRISEASILLREGKVQEAASLFDRIVRDYPQHPDALNKAAALAYQRGKLSDALGYLEQAIAAAPHDARNYYLRGLALEDLHRPEDAILSLQQAIRVKPDYAEAYNNIGILLHDQQRFEAAAAHFRDAIRHHPNYVRAYNNLGSSLRALGDFAGARQQFEQAVLLKPDYFQALYNLGLSCRELGELKQAEVHFSQTLRLKPDYIEAYNQLGHVQRQLENFEGAEACFTRAAQLKPGRNQLELNNLAQVFWDQGRFDQALAAYRQVQMLAPHDLKSALGAWLSLPEIYASREDLLAVRQRFAMGLQVLQDNIPNFIAANAPDVLLDHLHWSNFYLAYQGMDDKDLQIGYGRFVAAMLEKIAPQFMQPIAKKSAQGRRVRVGYLSSFFRDCTVGRYFLSWITQLDRERFEIFVYQAREKNDQITKEIADSSDHFRHLFGRGNALADIARKVKDDELDILVYPELGMDYSSFLLASMRLAPVQCMGWGHPVTSGHPNVDYYLSSTAMEPTQAAEHYAEKLVLLDGMGTHYGKPVLPAPGRRADYALPEGKTLYLCPQSLFKIHSDNDSLMARILERDQNGVIVLFAARHPNITNALRARLTHALQARGVNPAGRCVILPSMAHENYLRVNMLCDVMLDTLHWSGGNTTLDALACALPVVTLPGQFMRGRQSYGMLTLMGLDELVAKDQEDFIELAVTLGTDRTRREHVVRRIVASHGKIFEAQAPLRQLQQFYLTVGMA